MEKEQLTTEEIERLSKSPYVKLARDTAQQKLYRLRSLDKKGRQIAKNLGVDLEE